MNNMNNMNNITGNLIKLFKWLEMNKWALAGNLIKLLMLFKLIATKSFRQAPIPLPARS